MLEDEFGLAPAVGKVYAELVTMPSATTGDVAEALGIGDDDAAAALTSLQEHALASRADVAGEARWTAVPPLLTGQRLLVERAQRLFQAQQELLALAEAHQRAARAGGADSLVEVIIGAQAVRTQVQQLQANTSEEVLALVRPPFVAVSREEATSAPLNRRARVVYDQSLIEEGPWLIDGLRDSALPGDQHRIYPSVPMRLQIFDQRTAVLPLVRHDAQPAVLVLHPSGLLSLAIELFEAIWRHAAPLLVADDVDGGAPLRFEDRQILGMLLAGLTDEAIGHQLRRSQRWVQRRVRVMMDAANVQTRLQLGWEARGRGWLDGAADAVQPPDPGTVSRGPAEPPSRP